MGIERIIHGIGNLTRATAVSGILGLGILGAGSVPAYAQQNEKYASNVNYIQCTSQKNAVSRNNKSTAESLAILGVLAGSQKNPDLQTAGSLLLLLGGMRHQKDVAREGRSNVNVNQGQQITRHIPAPGCAWANPENPNDLGVRISLGTTFAANYWEDFNKNETAELDEFMGVKNTFYDDEEMMFVLESPLHKGFKGEPIIEWEVYGPTGKLYGDRVNSKGYGAIWINWKYEKEGHGDYVAVFRANGITEVMKFRIIPASERPEN